MAHLLKIKREKKFKETGDRRCQDIYQNKLGKSCFQHDMASRDFKDLTRRTCANRVLRDKAFNIAKDSNMLDIKKVLLQLLINFLIKKLLVVVVKMKIFLIKNLQKSYKNQLLECLIKGKYTHLLLIIFGVQI